MVHRYQNKSSPILYHHGLIFINYVRWNGSFSLDLNWKSINRTNWLECIGTYESEAHLTKPITEKENVEYRYLQYLTETRISHLERIRGFVTRKLKSIPRLSSDIKEAFTAALSFLNSSLLEATAYHYFAHGLSCVCVSLGALLNHNNRRN